MPGRAVAREVAAERGLAARHRGLTTGKGARVRGPDPKVVRGGKEHHKLADGRAGHHRLVGEYLCVGTRVKRKEERENDRPGRVVSTPSSLWANAYRGSC